MRGLKKKGQFNFVWIFAILAGGSILALAIWGAVQTGDTLRYGSDTEAARSISVITNPLQAGFAEGTFGRIAFQQETRINNICLDDSGFGKNDLSVATRSGVGNDWNLAGGAASIHNKYIFSEEQSEGLDYYVFSKPFNFPYEVSDLIFLTSVRYCFLGDTDDVADEVLGLGMENVVFDNCSASDTRVCFGGGQNCDFIVYGSCSGNCDSIYDEGVVSKRSGDLHYVGSLMWGAIFSDKGVYDCNVGRLMYRTKRIAEIFSAKADLMNARDCGTNLKVDLIVWSGLVGNASSSDLISLKGVDIDNHSTVVLEKAPAVMAGMKGAIVQADDVEILRLDDLRWFLENKNPGDVVRFTTENELGTNEYDVMLSEHPDGSGRAYLGVGHSQAEPRGIIQKVLSKFMGFKEYSTHYKPTWDGDFVYCGFGYCCYCS